MPPTPKSTPMPPIITNVSVKIVKQAEIVSEKVKNDTNKLCENFKSYFIKQPILKSYSFFGVFSTGFLIELDFRFWCMAFISGHSFSKDVRPSANTSLSPLEYQVLLTSVKSK